MIPVELLMTKRKELKSSETKVKDVSLQHLLETEPTNDGLNQVRDYFFEAAVDKWYENLPSGCTFRSVFVPLKKMEAFEIIDYWKSTSSKEEFQSVVIPEPLHDLVSRINEAIELNFSASAGVFVKLSTRSPKDSKTIFTKAVSAFNDRIDPQTGRVIVNSVTDSTIGNARLIAFSEEMIRASIAHSGEDAVTYLLDSWRVAEDLMYAYADENSTIDKEITIVIREWKKEMTPKCEFRGFVWNNELHCIGQYWHSLYWPDLVQRKEEIAQDCLTFFETIKASLPVPNAMLDLAWFDHTADTDAPLSSSTASSTLHSTAAAVAAGNRNEQKKQVILVEVNPLMEGLGSFKGSNYLIIMQMPKSYKVRNHLKYEYVHKRRTELVYFLICHRSGVNLFSNTKILFIINSCSFKIMVIIIIIIIIHTYINFKLSFVGRTYSRNLYLAYSDIYRHKIINYLHCHLFLMCFDKYKIAKLIRGDNLELLDAHSF
jgi:hypothetical protein